MGGGTPRSSAESLGRPPGVVAALGLLALTALLYGRHLGDAHLADDYVFLSWAEGGIVGLLRSAVFGPETQFLRPLPTLVWLVDGPPLGTVAHRAVSLLLHALCGWLVARLAARLSAAPPPGLPLMAGALFVAFPLFTEPVLWLSAAPDLWACAFGLTALELGLRDGSRPGMAPLAGALAGLCFAAGLSSKESIVLLPAILAVLSPRPLPRRSLATVGAALGVYVALRLALFGGAGGYGGGWSMVASFEPILFLRNLFLQVPYRILVPLKGAGSWAPWVAAVSLALMLAASAEGRVWLRLGPAARGAIAALLAVLPVAPLLSIGVDHEASRYLYFPGAVAAVASGAVLAAGSRRLVPVLGVLLALWGGATLHNGAAWTEASREVTATLEGLRRAERRLPRGATVAVAGHEVWKGVYVWRNALPAAALRAGLRHDLRWQAGTAELTGAAGPGHDVFELGLDPAGRLVDWTPCRAALRQGSAERLRSWAVPGDAVDVRRWPGVLSLVFDQTALSGPQAALAAEIEGGAPSGARLYWERDGVGFRVAASRRLRLGGGAAGRWVRLPPEVAQARRLRLRLDLEEGGMPEGAWALHLARAPEVCADPPPA